MLLLAIALSASPFVFAGEKGERTRPIPSVSTSTEPESLGDFPVSSDLEREIAETQNKIKALNKKTQTLQNIQVYQGYFDRLRARQSVLMPLLDTAHQTALQELLGEPTGASDLSQLPQESLDSELKRLEGKWPFLRIFLSIDAVHETFSAWLTQFRVDMSSRAPLSALRGDFDRASKQRILDFEREVIAVLSQKTRITKKTETNQITLDVSEAELLREMKKVETSLAFIDKSVKGSKDFFTVPLLAKWFALNLLLRTIDLPGDESPTSPFFVANFTAMTTMILASLAGGFTESPVLLGAAGISAAVSVTSGQLDKKWGPQVQRWQVKRAKEKRIQKLDKDLKKIISHGCAILLGRY